MDRSLIAAHKHRLGSATKAEVGGEPAAPGINTLGDRLHIQ
jgi:hypothetical protein